MKNQHSFRRTYEELDEVASKFWPAELSELEAQISIVPLLLKTQDQFISILSVEATNIDSLFKIIEASNLPANLFVKHLAILADFGGEPLKRISRNLEFQMLFPGGKLHYIWNNQPHIYRFKALPNQKFSNSKLHIDGKYLVKDFPLDDLKKDAIVILLFGSAYSGDDEETSNTLAKCEIGEHLGQPAKLNNFIKQRYIWVSRITGGAKANNLGQLAQKFVAEYINDNLNLNGATVQMSGRLPNVTHTDLITGRNTSFDIVVNYKHKHVAVEVSFQVTTNSTFERKSGQAKDRFEQIESAGHKIAYVLDGAGNFEREQAMRTILAHNHCSVAFSRDELNKLCDFLREVLTG